MYCLTQNTFEWMATLSGRSPTQVILNDTDLDSFSLAARVPTLFRRCTATIEDAQPPISWMALMSSYVTSSSMDCVHSAEAEASSELYFSFSFRSPSEGPAQPGGRRGWPSPAPGPGSTPSPYSDPPESPGLAA